MRWQQTEFILKGICLGMLVFVALLEPSWQDIGTVALWTFGTLGVCLGVAAARKLREGYRVKGRLPAFILFLLLENPGLVYAGVLLGLALGAFSLAGEEHGSLLVYSAGGGTALGLLFWYLRQVRDDRNRLWLNLALAVVLVGGAVGLFLSNPTLLGREQRQMLGALLLLGIVPFYLLTFASLVEESEVEIGAMCAALGVGMWLLGEQVSPTFQSLALALPIVLYFVYTRRILPGLKVFKHVLRGISYATVDRYAPALVSLGRALQLDPSNSLAREQLWSVHRQMDLDSLSDDPETLALVNFELCLDRAASLLLTTPRPEQLAEAHRLLDFVGKQRPAMTPRCDYWRAVAFLHERRYDDAAAALSNVLAGNYAEPESPHRRVILLLAWQLALTGHPEMKHRVANKQLAEPGRKMEAIAAVERQLAAQPDDSGAWDLKRLLYSTLTEPEYEQGAPAGQAAEAFDHGYAQQLGLAHVADPARWQRGVEYLRIAARGLPQNGPTVWIEIAKANQRAGQIRETWEAYRQAREAGRRVGPKNLSQEDRQAYFAVVKMLADSAREGGDVEAAIENYRLYTEYERAGIETYRALADLHERNKDSWAALHAAEQGLVYDASDKDLLERKDRYYYSVQPSELAERREQVGKWFDIDYCVRKARWILDKHGTDLDLLDWASHLLELAQVGKPDSLTVRVLRGRVRRLRGEMPEAIALLEEVRGNRPEKFPSGEEEESWYMANRLLGDIYLHEDAAKAIECLQEWRKSPKSGADTSYKLGVAYENLGDRAKAKRCYEQVVAFETHPLAPEAHEALSRLQQAASS